MTSVSNHGGLVHVVMNVKTLKVNGITSLVRNSLQLMGMDVSLKNKFWNRKLFTAGHCKVARWIKIKILNKN